MKLTAQLREKVGSNGARALRKAGRVPAVIYGGSEPKHVSVAREDIDRLLKSRERLLDLDLGGETEHVLLKHAQFDTFGAHPIHLDFFRVTDETVVKIRVPLEFKGMPVGVMQGGIVERVCIELMIEGPVSKLPTHLVVPIEELEIGKILHIDEVPMPEGVRPAPELDPRSPVAAVRAVKKRAEKTAEEEAADEAVELEAAAAAE